MEIRKLLEKHLPLFLILAVATASRLLPHPPNFTPVTGIALFSGIYFQGKKRFVLPVLIMAISDIFLGFHSTMPYVYGSFFAITLLGSVFLKELRVTRIIILSLSSSLLFYFVTNFGVWLATNMYEKSVAGLIESYVMGIPFLKNTIAGDLFYTSLLLGGYRYLNTLIVSIKGAGVYK